MQSVTQLFLLTKRCLISAAKRARTCSIPVACSNGLRAATRAHARYAGILLTMGLTRRVELELGELRWTDVVPFIFGGQSVVYGAKSYVYFIPWLGHSRDK